jgi:hypothetical protein
MWLVYLVIGVLYLGVCLVFMLYIGIPVAIVGGPLALFGGFCAGHLMAVGVLVGKIPADRITGPADAPALGARPAPGSEDVDPAWPRYFLGQIQQDTRSIARQSQQYVTPGWRHMRSFTKERGIAVWPLIVVGYAVVGAWTAGVYLAIVLVTAVSMVVASLARSTGGAVALVVRGGSRARQRLLRATASCPSCYYITSLPVFLCPGCAAQHRELRPGPLGVLRRYCSCGRVLPTSVHRAAHELDAVCPRSGHPLPRGAAAQTDVRVPVFGASSSGKTQLIMNGIVALAATEQNRSELFVDEASKRQFGQFTSTLDAGTRAAKTAAALPIALTIQLTLGWRRALVHVFDAAGEHFVHGGRNDDLAYIDQARTLIFVLDPFSIPDVRSQVEEGFGDLLARANAATHDPEDSYNVTVMRLRAHGVDTDRQRLAFVVSKADLLLGVPIGEGLGSSSDAVSGWLIARGLDNFVTAAKRDFREVRYFLVASTPEAKAPLRARLPFEWVLQHERVTVPVLSTTGE